MMGKGHTTFGPDDVPPIQFAEARGARIAYQDFGTGPAVVGVPPTAQNIEASWEWPEVASMLARFGSFARWIQFDKRGTGASDRRSQMPGIDERVHDLEAVMSAAGVERSFIYGASEGGPMCLLFAATYPERVEGVILHGAAAYTESPDQTEEDLAARRKLFDDFCGVFGTDESPMVDAFAPSMAGDQAFREWHCRYERKTADRGSLRELLEISLSIDVRDVLPSIEAPVLMLHRTGDMIIPVEWARDTASLLPNATLIEHEGNDHFGYAGDRSWMDDLERFVTGSVGPRHRAIRNKAVSVRTLGKFAVEVDGVEVPTAAWGSRRSRQLCKRLVAARGWPVTRDALFDQLWPDEHDARKLGARLSVQLSAVRRVLGGGVVADRETVALDLTAVQTDLEDLFQTTTPEAIVECYAGDFLPEDPYDDWTTGIRDEARHRFATAAAELATAAVADGQHEVAVRLAHRLLEADDFDDGAHRLLVSALIAQEHIGEARRAYGRWSTVSRELGVEPPPFADFST